MIHHHQEQVPCWNIAASTVRDPVLISVLYAGRCWVRSGFSIFASMSIWVSWEDVSGGLIDSTVHVVWFIFASDLATCPKSHRRLHAELWKSVSGWFTSALQYWWHISGKYSAAFWGTTAGMCHPFSSSMIATAIYCSFSSLGTRQSQRWIFSTQYRVNFVAVLYDSDSYVLRGLCSCTLSALMFWCNNTVSANFAK